MTKHTSSKRAVFLDRDGVLVESIHGDYIRASEQINILPNIRESLEKLIEKGFELIIVTNQGAVSKGLINLKQANALQAEVVDLIRPTQHVVIHSYLCPHQQKDECTCRKPQPGMLFQASKDHGLDLAKSYLVGDASTDVLAAKKAGVSPILVLTGRGYNEQHKATRIYNQLPIVNSLKEAVEIIQ